MTIRDEAFTAVARMNATSEDCMTFDRSTVQGPLIADIMQQSMTQNYAAACIDAGRLLPKLLAELDQARSDASRYRLAWTSARQRAENHWLALVDADDERDALRAMYVEQGQNVDIARSQRNECLKANYELIAERDEARAEVVRLGQALDAAQIIADEAVSKAHREAGTW